MRHRRPCAAGAELDRAVLAHVRQAAPNALGEAPPIGVVADPPAVLEHHGVDGAQRPRVVGQGVQQRDHRLLAGMGDVEAGEAAPLSRLDQFRQGLDAAAELLEVDQLVLVTQPLFGAFAHMHGRSPRRLDAGADQADAEGGRVVMGHKREPDRNCSGTADSKASWIRR
jgi:hypothetical protein